MTESLTAPLPGFLSAWLSGMVLGFSLIVAIGAQNAFVLRQGLKGEHVFAVALICALSDALLIAAGVAGMGGLVAAWPALGVVLRWGGAAFLAAYAMRSFRAAWRGGGALHPGAEAQSLSRVLALCLAFTWANPHVWLDTVVLIGSVSTRWPGREVAFAAGAMTASFAFFFGLAYGARFLRPVFARPRAWQVLEAVIGVLMLVLAAGLVWPGQGSGQTLQ